MKVTFVVLNRNNQDFLNKCLLSIKKMGIKNQEVVLVDDASDDNSIKNLKYQPSKLIINKKRLGIAESRNIGYSKATGEYVFFIDSDIEIKHLDFENIHKLFQSDSKLVAASGNYHGALKNKDWNAILDLRRKEIFCKDKKEYIYTLKDKYTTFSGGFCVLNKKRIKKINQSGKLSNAGEDVLFQVKLLNKGHSFAYTPELEGIHYHKRPLSQALKKAESEAKGNIWLMQDLIQNNLEIPVLERIFTGPILLLFGLIINPIFLLIEFFPYLYLIITQPNSDSLRLLLYTIWVEVVEVFYLIKLLIDRNLSVKNKLMFVKSILVNSFEAKYKWVINKI